MALTEAPITLQTTELAKRELLEAYFMTSDDFKSVRAWLGCAGGWHLPNTAKAFENRGALAGLWISDKNRTGVAPSSYRRSWPFQLAMKPFFHLAPQIGVEKAFYALFPIWKYWFLSQPFPQCNVVQAIMGFATEPFDQADKIGALKVVDCANSHPTTYYGYWQRECDLWCPEEKVPIPRWMFARMTRELQRADVVLCPSTFVRDSMIQNDIPEEKCFLNPFGVNTQNFQPRENVPDHPRFISVGTICLRKGHQYLLKAFEIVKKQLPDAELICVGSYKTDFRYQRKKWEGTFTHYPSLSHPDLSKLLKQCSAFVFPSCEEGFARVIPEAMASGLPIIATHESGATTLVKDGVQGFIVRRDSEQIAAAMIKIALDKDKAKAMGNAAYTKGAERNTWQDYGDRLLKMYQQRLLNR
ncbi:MAG: glycosyltransferase family 4 protein [Chthoniobacteraceae bacterium]